jgi:hypothetical protein
MILEEQERYMMGNEWAVLGRLMWVAIVLLFSRLRELL